MPKKFLVLLTLLIWIACLAAGLSLSQRRPLWNDELYSFTQSIEPISYGAILQGRVPEGNNNPLFYVVQKGFCDITSFRFQKQWKGREEWYLRDPQSQVMLRVVSNVLMSTAIAIVFYFWAARSSLGLALFAVAALAVMPSVWMYWIESRPYALWIFLTTLQSVLLLRISDDPERTRNQWRRLAVVHILLALTVSLGVVQALAGSLVLILLKERRWQRYVFFALLPLIIGVYYYTRSPKYNFFFQDGPVRLLLQNVPAEFCLLLAATVLAIIFVHGRSLVAIGRENLERLAYPVFAVIMLGVACAFLGYLKLKAVGVTMGFGISSRYFLFLIPVAVMSLTLGIGELWRLLKGNRWMRLNMAIVVVGVLLLTGAKTGIYILNSATFTHIIR